MSSVSAIITVYNYGRFLGEAIESALNQTYPPLEVIVVDDGSTDDTPEVATRYRDRIQYTRTPNRGVSAARNTAIAQAKGDLIAILDADDRWLPTKLERQVPIFANGPTVGLVHTGSRVFDHQTGMTLCEPLPEPIMDFHDVLRWCAISLPSAVVPRRVFADVGGFDEQLSATADWEMWIRIAAKYEVIGCREVLVDYRTHGANMSSRAFELMQSCMAALDKSKNIHRNCRLCRESIRDARKHARMEYYDKASAIARDHLRCGRFLEGLAWRVRSVWHCPHILVEAPRILRERLRPSLPHPVEPKECQP